MTSVLTMPPAATATGVVTTTPDGAEDGHTSRTNPARLRMPRGYLARFPT